MNRPQITPRAAEEGVSSASTGSSAERSLRLLALVAQAGRPLSLADLAAELALPKPSVHRLCTNLVAQGFLARDVDDRSFAAGPALRQLAFNTLNNGVLGGQRRAVLAELVAQIGETCNFTTIDGTEVLYIDRVEARWPLRLTLDVGSHVPLHCTASGKLFLSMMPAARREALIARLPLPRMTPSTITAPQALLDECNATAQRGYACDREEFVGGLIAVAVPVRDADGRVRAAIAVHAPVARMSLEQALAQLPSMQAAAGRMQELL